MHLVPPPLNLNSTLRELQREENDNNSDDSAYKNKTHHQPTIKTNESKEEPLTAIQSTTQHIVKLTPPRKVPLPHHILENEPHHEPTTIVDPRRWWYPTHTVQNNRCAHPLDPRVRVLAAPDPEGYGEEDTDDDSVEVPVVDGADAELACWADETPVGWDDGSQQVVQDKRRATHQTALAV